MIGSSDLKILFCYVTIYANFLDKLKTKSKLSKIFITNLKLPKLKPCTKLGF